MGSVVEFAVLVTLTSNHTAHRHTLYWCIQAPVRSTAVRTRLRLRDSVWVYINCLDKVGTARTPTRCPSGYRTTRTTTSCTEQPTDTDSHFHRTQLRADWPAAARCRVHSHRERDHSRQSRGRGRGHKHTSSHVLTPWWRRGGQWVRCSDAAR